MKSGIHPDYVETTVLCGCGAHVHDAQHQEERTHRRRGLLAVPPLLHRQAEDPRQRRPRGPLREALRQAQGSRRREGCTTTSYSDRRPLCRATRRPGVGSCSAASATGRSTMTDTAPAIDAHAGRARRPRTPALRSRAARRCRCGPQGRPAVRAARADRLDLPQAGSGPRRPRGRPRAGRRRRLLRRRGRPSSTAPSKNSTPSSPTCWRRATRTTPTTSCSR